MIEQHALCVHMFQNTDTNLMSAHTEKTLQSLETEHDLLAVVPISSEHVPLWDEDGQSHLALCSTRANQALRFLQTPKPGEKDLLLTDVITRSLDTQPLLMAAGCVATDGSLWQNLFHDTFQTALLKTGHTGYAVLCHDLLIFAFRPMDETMDEALAETPLPRWHPQHPKPAQTLWPTASPPIIDSTGWLWAQKKPEHTQHDVLANAKILKKREPLLKSLAQWCLAEDIARRTLTIQHHTQR